MKNPFTGRILLIRRKYIVALALIAAVVAIFYLINQAGHVGASARVQTAISEICGAINLG